MVRDAERSKRSIADAKLGARLQLVNGGTQPGLSSRGHGSESRKSRPYPSDGLIQMRNSERAATALSLLLILAGVVVCAIKLLKHFGVL